MLWVSLEIMDNRKGLLKFTMVSGPTFPDKGITLIPVAAAASVPVSATLITVLWTTCGDTRALPTRDRVSRREADGLVPLRGLTFIKHLPLTCHCARQLVQFVCSSQQSVTSFAQSGGADCEWPAQVTLTWVLLCLSPQTMLPPKCPLL